MCVFACIMQAFLEILTKKPQSVGISFCNQLESCLALLLAYATCVI